MAIHSASWPNQNNNEWTGFSEVGAGGFFDWPVGRTTRCARANGSENGDKAFCYQTIGAYGNGQHYHSQFYFNIDLDTKTSDSNHGIWVLINDANSAGIALYLNHALSGGKRRLRLENTAGVGGYSSYALAIDTYYKIDVYVELQNDATGKMALLIDDVEEVRDDAINTRPNGTIDRVKAGLLAWAAPHIVALKYDDYVDTTDVYSPWAVNVGSPLRRGIVSPVNNDGSSCRGIVNGGWPYY